MGLQQESNITGGLKSLKTFLAIRSAEVENEIFRIYASPQLGEVLSLLVARKAEIDDLIELLDNIDRMIEEESSTKEEEEFENSLD